MAEKYSHMQSQFRRILLEERVGNDFKEMRSKNETYNISLHHSVIDKLSNDTKKSEVDHVEAIVIVTLLVVIMIISLFGNLIVVVIVTKKRRMQTFTNWMILNLSIADLWVALLSIPLEIPMELNNKQWIYGKTFCSIFYPLQTSCVYGSVFTLVALSFSRFWAIVKPFNRQPNIFMAKVLIGFIWICSFIVVIPYMSVLNYSEDDDGVQHCEEKWTNTQKRTYTIALFLFQYVFPLTIICMAYIYIIRELCYRKKTENNNCKIKQLETKKVVKLLCIITMTFAICVLPYHIFALCVEFGALDEEKNNIISLICYIFLYTNSALNPVIYNIFNAEFRESFKELYRTVIIFIFYNIDSEKNIGFFSKRRRSCAPSSRTSKYSEDTFTKSRNSRFTQTFNKMASHSLITVDIDTCQ
ncbi:galanin receptor 2a isoform X1 [Hydra vulgaris]|uniref:Galanin receptor 2a isoform X1 n=2 Tax=Hydra vulgaris TaxID=6087 RepID=A0ABM4CZM5_HYDVU